MRRWEYTIWSILRNDLYTFVKKHILLLLASVFYVWASVHVNYANTNHVQIFSVLTVLSGCLISYREQCIKICHCDCEFIFPFAYRKLHLCIWVHFFIWIAYRLMSPYWCWLFILRSAAAISNDASVLVFRVILVWLPWLSLGNGLHGMSFSILLLLNCVLGCRYRFCKQPRVIFPFWIQPASLLFDMGSPFNFYAVTDTIVFIYTIKLLFSIWLIYFPFFFTSPFNLHLG
jgi:hypothetical protein